MPYALAATNAPAVVAYGVEAVVALASTVTVAPIIAMVDKAIFSNASGAQPLAASLRDSLRSTLSRPTALLRNPSFWWIWLVYGGTYTAANWTSLTCERAHVAASAPKFASTSTANISLSVLKDRAFARMYGVISPKPVPLPSLALFAGRDSLSIAASFTLPSVIAHTLHNTYGVSVRAADTAAQLTVPLAAQVISTPMHLFGMDMYNSPHASGAQRLAFIAREYVATTAARMARVLPAFGAGGIINKRLREAAHGARAKAYGLRRWCEGSRGMGAWECGYGVSMCVSFVY